MHVRRLHTNYINILNQTVLLLIISTCLNPQLLLHLELLHQVVAKLHRRIPCYKLPINVLIIQKILLITVVKKYSRMLEALQVGESKWVLN